MTGPELNYDIHDKELLAIVEAFREWRVYLEGSKYTIKVYSDHRNLTYWTTTKQLNRRQVRWSETLASYDFQILHVKGSENGRADTLSRQPDYSEGIKPAPASILQQHGEALMYHQPMTVAATDETPTEEQKLQILQQRHDAEVAGHPGIDKTIELITRDYHWPGIRKDVQEYIKKCNVCAKTKIARHKPYGELQALAAPKGAWKSVTLDFITKLPKLKEPLTGIDYDSVLVIINRLTK